MCCCLEPRLLSHTEVQVHGFCVVIPHPYVVFRFRRIVGNKKRLATKSSLKTMLQTHVLSKQNCAGPICQALIPMICWFNIWCFRFCASRFKSLRLDAGKKETWHMKYQIWSNIKRKCLRRNLGIWWKGDRDDTFLQVTMFAGLSIVYVLPSRL